jgi:hypothetical protein
MKANLYSLMALSMMGQQYDFTPRRNRTRFVEYKRDDRTDGQKLSELLTALKNNESQYKQSFTAQGFYVGGNTLKSTTKWIRKTLADSGFSPNSTYNEIGEKISLLTECR